MIIIIIILIILFINPILGQKKTSNELEVFYIFQKII